jgi:hypothetical protein
MHVGSNGKLPRAEIALRGHQTVALGQATVSVFVSYSHKDRRHLEKLRDHLAPLERNGEVEIWWDGRIEPGQYWETRIRDRLLNADIVVLLLTANFFSSDYCVDKELQLAREREREGHADIIPILVHSCLFESHWIGQLQAIKAFGNLPVAETTQRDKAWAYVARQLQLKFGCVRVDRPVILALNEVEEVVHSGQRKLEAAERVEAAHHEFDSVGSFWQARSILAELDRATVPGTFSQYAPMIMGPPRTKRLLHREFRRAVEGNRKFGVTKRLTINTCMSISAGQMVMRIQPQDNEKRLFGLYNSIVRNSIPVYVLPEFYSQHLAKHFTDSGSSGCFQARITGRVLKLDNSFIRRLLVRQGLERILPRHLIEELAEQAYALEVGGPETKVEPSPETPAYLDGDVWLAVSSGKTERFLTSFLNICSGEERQEEFDRLQEEARRMDGRVIAQFDGLHSIAQLALDETRGPVNGGPRAVPSRKRTTRRNAV